MKKSYQAEAQSSADAQALFDLLNEAAIIAQLSRALLETALPDGLTAHHFGVLNHLVRLGDGKTPLALARAFQVPKTTMTHVLSGLLKRNLIREIPNPEDGRSKMICLTDEGRLLRQQAVADSVVALTPIRSQLDTDEVERLLPALRQLRALLDNARNLD